MDKFQQIDSATVENLFNQHRDELLRFLTGLFGDSHLAADSLQTIFAKLIESSASMTATNVRSWMFKVGYNQAMEYRRRGGTTKRVLENLLQRNESLNVGRDLNPEVEFERREIVELALAKLNTKQLEVVRKRIYEDKKFSLIADELGIPLGTVLTRMRSAMELLSKEIDQNDFDDN